MRKFLTIIGITAINPRFLNGSHLAHGYQMRLCLNAGPQYPNHRGISPRQIFGGYPATGSGS